MCGKEPLAASCGIMCCSTRALDGLRGGGGGGGVGACCLLDRVPVVVDSCRPPRCRAWPDPILAYTADGEISQMRWPAAQPDWIGITYNNSLQLLRV